MPQQINKLLVPVSGEHAAEAALPLVAKLSQALDAEVVLLNVTILPETTEQAAETRDSAHDALVNASQQLPGSVRHRVEETGDPVKGILHAIVEEKPDLVIMATHGRSGLAGFTEGSIAYDVVTAGIAPVTLVPIPEDADDS